MLLSRRGRRRLTEPGLRRRVWTIARADDDTAIGQVSLRFDGHRATLGYVLARAFWGRGLATEAARAAVAAALALPHIELVWAYCDVDNRASARVMEKAGMQSEGVLRRWAVHPNLSNKRETSLPFARALLRGRRALARPRQGQEPAREEVVAVRAPHVERPLQIEIPRGFDVGAPEGGVALPLVGPIFPASYSG